jgi:SAM-dependent methyltransferase
VNQPASSISRAGWREVLALYGPLAPAFKLRFLIRWKHGNPFERLEEQVPSTGRIVDLGCGSGYFANLLSLRSPRREILGVDIDERQIQRAQSSVVSRERIRFEVRDLMRVPLPPCDAVVTVDVLHHMTFEQQDHILRVCHQALVSGGVLLVLDVDVKPKWKYLYNYLFDSMTGFFGITQGAALNYQGTTEMTHRLQRAGFTDVRVTPFAKRDLAARVLYRAVKPS